MLVCTAEGKDRLASELLYRRCITRTLRHTSSTYAKKLKLSHNTLRRRLGGEEYSSYSFSTSALDAGEWSASCPGRALAPEKGPPEPIVQEAGWAPEPVWTQRLQEKSSCLRRGSNTDRPVVQPVFRHYTDCATLLTAVHYATQVNHIFFTYGCCMKLFSNTLFFYLSHLIKYRIFNLCNELVSRY
jgi:hypothetical protein